MFLGCVMIVLQRYKNMKSKVRERLYKMVLKMYGSGDMGVNSLLSAITDYKDHLIIMFVDNIIKGGISYYITKKSSSIEVDHLGIVDRGIGYGTMLMREIFNVAKSLGKAISLVANGFANDFYEKLGMYKVNDKIPTVYEMSRDQIMSM
jgi:GNAT superfamily N-acetyltransferase